MKKRNVLESGTKIHKNKCSTLVIKSAPILTWLCTEIEYGLPSLACFVGIVKPRIQTKSIYLISNVDGLIRNLVI